MPGWTVKRTDTFLKEFKKLKGHHELLKELDKKIRRLQQDPERLGGLLSGPLHGKKSTRLAGKFRLIFQVNPRDKTVYLVAVDHRGKVYDQ